MQLVMHAALPASCCHAVKVKENTASWLMQSTTRSVRSSPAPAEPSPSPSCVPLCQCSPCNSTFPSSPTAGVVEPRVGLQPKLGPELTDSCTAISSHTCRQGRFHGRHTEHSHFRGASWYNGALEQPDTQLWLVSHTGCFSATMMQSCCSEVTAQAPVLCGAAIRVQLQMTVHHNCSVVHANVCCAGIAATA